MKVFISTSGRVEHIGSGLFEEGVAHRASHVEPEGWLYRLWFHIVRYWSPNESAIAEWTRGWRTRWRANLGPSRGPILGPFALRKEAIASEVAWLEENYLGHSAESGPAPKCDWCGRFTKRYTIHQPYTECWKLEPNDPELLCERCSKSALYSVDGRERSNDGN